MRHNKKGTHLGRTTSHKKALIRNLVISLIEHKSIKTTHAKAREARRFADKLITYAKKGSVHHRRLAFRFLQNKNAVKILFDEIGPACAERPGGYSHIVKLGFRSGDAAPVSLLELVDFVTIVNEKKKQKKAEKATKKEKAEKASEVAEKVKEKEENEVEEVATETEPVK